MKRVLLVIDDYRELVFLQTLLKKMGFDVDGTQNAKKFDDMRLALNPEIVIASSKGNNVNGLKLAEELKKPQGIPKFILIVPHQMAKKIHGLQLKNVDGIIDSPIEAKKLLATLASVSELNSETLIEKYRKIVTQLDADNESDLNLLKMQQEFEAEESRVKGKEVSSENKASNKKILSQSSISQEERQKRMNQAVEELEEPKVDGFPKEVVHSWNKKIRTEEASTDISDLEDERQAFVRSLFKKTDD